MGRQSLVGLVAASLVAGAGLRLRSLTRSGSLAAAAVGAAVHAGMGTRGSAAVVAFFVSSSALSQLPARGGARQRRGSQRDAIQVLANGGPAGAFASWHGRCHNPPGLLSRAAFYGSVAAVTADTWATEIGTRWGKQPRHILTGSPVGRGVSGGVTAPGFAASAAGALVIGLIATGRNASPVPLLLETVTGGVSGALLDSILGASVQERRRCPVCETNTESIRHDCGRSTILVGGIAGMNNDVVNAIAATAGGVAAAVTASAIAGLTRRNKSRVEFVSTTTSSRSPQATAAS